jgi:hypothetical protein
MLCRGKSALTLQFTPLVFLRGQEALALVSDRKGDPEPRLDFRRPLPPRLG